MKQRCWHAGAEVGLDLEEVVLGLVEVVLDRVVVEFDTEVFREVDLVVGHGGTLGVALVRLAIEEDFEEGHGLEVIGIGGMDHGDHGLIFIGIQDWVVGIIPAGRFLGGGTHDGVIRFM